MANDNKTKLHKKKQTKVKAFVKKKKTPESVLIDELKSKYDTIDISKASKFTDLPISAKTIKALKESNYNTLTDIQKASIPLALQGKDILGAAQTGSGKTLAFLIPILELLYCEKWTHFDGVGALVITPTRELAYQIFETLRKVGKHHDFSAGLIIGGKDLKFERKRMDQCNIVICTPGRLLQHMDENPLFDCSNMRVLVLDEADRCLDMGFKETMNAIIANFPPKRQTLLFSATQTKSVQDLARLSLKDPSYVSVNEMMTPKDLSQSYIQCKLEDKLSIIWSFIRHHRKKKIIIFFSTCKQVKYFYEMFCRLRPGLSLLALYGTLHQLRRMKIYEDFCKKSCAVLFATDLAARGLDFPEVHWVVQADCPEDVATYIHRVGRTARYHKGGESLLMLMPSELKMIEYLEEKKIPIENIDINPAKLETPLRKMDLFISKDEELKNTAQRAVSHYAKAVFLMKDKSVFDVRALDLQTYAQSLGLPAPPRIRFLERVQWRQNARNNAVKPKAEDKIDEPKAEALSEENGALKHSHLTTFPVSLKQQVDDNDSDEDSDPFEMCTNFDIKNAKGFKPIAKSNEIAAITPNNNRANTKIVFEENLPGNEAGVESTKPPLGFERSAKVKLKSKVITKAALVKKMIKTGELINRKTVFNDEGEAISVGPNQKKSDLAKEFELEAACGIDIEKTKSVLREEDKYDRRSFHEKLKAKRKEEKMKLKAKLKKEREEKDDDDSDDAPDLTWLPDPNKIYDEENNPTSGDETKAGDRLQNETSSISDSEHMKQEKAAKKKSKKRKSESAPIKKPNKLAKLGTELDVAETEALTLMLLKGQN